MEDRFLRRSANLQMQEVLAMFGADQQHTSKMVKELQVTSMSERVSWTGKKNNFCAQTSKEGGKMLGVDL